MFDTYLAWHAEKQRRDGREPTQSTLTAKRYRLLSTARLAGADSAETLAACLGERKRWAPLLDKMQARLHPGTVVAALVALRQFAEYAVLMGWIEASAIEQGDAPRHIPQKQVTVYGRGEVDQLLLYGRARYGFRYWAFLMTLTETGRRVSEVLSLRFADLRTDDAWHFELPSTKSGKQQVVPVNRVLREQVWTPDHIAELRCEVNALWGRDPAVYPFPWQYAAVNERLRSLCKVAGVEYRGFHVFRHSRATELLAKGVPLHAVSSLLGHSSVSVTQRVYDHTTPLSYAEYLDA